MPSHGTHVSWDDDDYATVYLAKFLRYIIYKKLNLNNFKCWIFFLGDSPCTLNCRPLGKHFYASLSLVADGTPCTRPGFRAICVQGACKVSKKLTIVIFIIPACTFHCLTTGHRRPLNLKGLRPLCPHGPVPIGNYWFTSQICADFLVVVFFDRKTRGNFKMYL